MHHHVLIHNTYRRPPNALGNRTHTHSPDRTSAHLGLSCFPRHRYESEFAVDHFVMTSSYIPEEYGKAATPEAFDNWKKGHNCNFVMLYCVVRPYLHGKDLGAALTDRSL